MVGLNVVKFFVGGYTSSYKKYNKGDIMIELEYYGTYFYRTGKIPPLNLLTCGIVYNNLWSVNNIWNN